MDKYPEPKPPVDLPKGSGWNSEYNGRKFFGPGASDRAELTYLRDWKRWAEREMGREHKI